MVLAIVLAGILLSACGDARQTSDGSSGARQSDDSRAAGNGGAHESDGRRSAADATGSERLDLLSPGAEHSFRRLEARLGGVAGVTVSHVGRHRAITRLGSLRSGVAWSTIKVPIAIAVLAETLGAVEDETMMLVRRAITESDNVAADQLWTLLGGGEHAARTVEATLGRAGDTRTAVQSRRVRQEFSPFGQTQWSLVDQQRFIAGLPCLPEARPVLEFMRRVVEPQRWGLSLLSDARFKGGWGPEQSGAYLVRQMAIAHVKNRDIAFTIATRPPDGSFATGVLNATRIARWLAMHVDPRAATESPSC